MAAAVIPQRRGELLAIEEAMNHEHRQAKLWDHEEQRVPTCTPSPSLSPLLAHTDVSASATECLVPPTPATPVIQGPLALTRCQDSPLHCPPSRAPLLTPPAPRGLDFLVAVWRHGRPRGERGAVARSPPRGELRSSRPHTLPPSTTSSRIEKPVLTFYARAGVWRRVLSKNAQT
ncbi:hypothetical protein E2C01_035270 [Portunus trituberculatus]|uniref:Uncharacterized protein n=1 Tax=Portunus trituberculatus TaxID=210409 RepID=A0A5B7F2S3_PORTR|nr:hypothetical protein [Portunus trituberculatus]